MPKTNLEQAVSASVDGVKMGFAITGILQGVLRSFALRLIAVAR